MAAAFTGPQTVLVTGSALEGFEGICEAVAKHRHFAAMARWAWNEGEAPTGLARLGELYPLETIKKKKYLIYTFFILHTKFESRVPGTSSMYKLSLVFVDLCLNM